MYAKQSVLLRQQLLIDRGVQGSLLRRAALYSCACGLYFVVILVLSESMSHPDEPVIDSFFRCLDDAIYWAPGLMLLVPMIAYDLLKLTNRFAGPVFRLRREMQRLVDGESEVPLSFRDGDYWVEMADIFNSLREELMELRQTRQSVEGAGEGDGSDSEGAVSHSKLFTDDSDDEVAEDFLVGSGE